MSDTLELRQKANDLIASINRIEIENLGAISTREKLEQNIKALKERAGNDKEALDIATHAIEILRQVSDETVSEAYKFLEQNLNAALEKMFTNTTRKIRIKEYTRSGQYPQLELELEVGNGIKRSLKTDSGHGLAQIVSILSILCLIVITGSRRILVMDEVVSGLSVRNRKILADIMWTFTDIGFQFLVNEHGFLVENAKIYHLEMVGGVSHVKQSYIATKGVYLQGGNNEKYDYSLKANNNVQRNESEESEESDEILSNIAMVNLDATPQLDNQPQISVPSTPTVEGNIISI